MNTFEVLIENEKKQIIRILVKANTPGGARVEVESLLKDGVKVIRVDPVVDVR